MCKQINLPMNNEGNLDYEKFKNIIKEQVPPMENSSQMLEVYKDLGNIPPTFYMLKKGSHLKYGQFIMVMLEDKSLYVREFLFQNADISDKFILSFSALVMMYKLGVKSSYFVENDVVISKSTIQEIQDEKTEIVRTNNQEIVSTMGIVQEELYIQSASEDEKTLWMKEAVGFEQYVQKIQTQENTSDIVVPQYKEIDWQEIFGICDYDAMAIAKSTERVLVSGEMMSIVAFPPEENVEKEIGILDFLVAINVELLDLLDYMTQMVKCRFLVILTRYSLTYILKKYEEISDFEKQEKVMGKWINYLYLDDEIDEEYRNLFAQRLIDVFRELFEENEGATNPIWIHFVFSIRKYYVETIQPQVDLVKIEESVDNKNTEEGIEIW